MQERFTPRGSATVEAEIKELVRSASTLLDAHLRPRTLRVLALTGGYGRGEGGVERRGAVERPHNNLDFLVVLERAPHPSLKGVLDRAMERLRRESGVGIDVGLVTVPSLRRAPCLVMWYDLRHGHKALAGDAAFLPSLRHFTREAIVPEDVRNLLVNRGTLLVLNEALREQDEETRRTLVRHMVKAIIGYGDALLFFRGQYHWSYVEKRRRMAFLREAPEAFRRLYDDASAFRLEPDYSRPPGALAPGREETREQLAAVHLACESVRLSVPGLRWADYLGLALRRPFAGDGPWAPRVWLRKARNGLRFRPPVPAGLRVGERLGLHLGGPRGLLGATFPVIAYGVGGERDRELARQVLGAASPAAADLRRAFLRCWGDGGDANFESFTRKHGLSLADAPEAGAR